MPRVTEVLDYSSPPQLTNWFKNNSKAKCERIGAHTAGIGTIVDELVQQDIDEGGYVPPEDNEEARNCLEQWEILKKDHPEFVTSVKEMQIDLEWDGITGHPDYYCEEGDEWGIADLKCTGGIRTKNWFQVGKYAELMMKMRKLQPPSFLRIIRLPRDGGTYEWLEIKDEKMIKYCMDAFQHYLAVFNNEPTMNEYFRQQKEEELLS
jgi:hypothetical protein